MLDLRESLIKIGGLPMSRNPKFEIGQKVRYCHSFLNSIVADSNTSSLIGVVQSTKMIGNKWIVIVLWDDGILQSSLSSNLTNVNFDVTE